MLPLDGGEGKTMENVNIKNATVNTTVLKGVSLAVEEIGWAGKVVYIHSYEGVTDGNTLFVRNRGGEYKKLPFDWTKAREEDKPFIRFIQCDDASNESFKILKMMSPEEIAKYGEAIDAVLRDPLK